MEYKDFIKETVLKLDKPLLEELKDIVIGEYIPTSFIRKADISSDFLIEKIYDYYKVLEHDKLYCKDLIEYYTDILNQLVQDKIADTPRTKKNEPIPKTPRARKYYEKAMEIKKTKEWSFPELLDYSRIMICLYATIVEAGYETIENVEFSRDSINTDFIVSTIRRERKNNINRKQVRYKIDIKDEFGKNRAAIIMLTIILCYMKN